MKQKNTIPKKIVKMPIDQFGRYFVVSEIIKELAELKKQKNVKILDIGGYNGSFNKFFTNNGETKFNITILDLYESSAKNYVKGSALNIPFKNNSYDYAVSFEVFEHIPRQHRHKYISEAVRVSQGPFIMTAPFNDDNDSVLKSEVLLNNLWKKVHNREHEWLKEHIEYKTPKIEEIEEIIKSHKLPFRRIGNNELTLWNLMQSLSFITTIHRPSGQNEKVQEFYNSHIDILESENSTFYRQIYIIGEDAERNLKGLKVQSDENRKRDLINELINRTFIAIYEDIGQLNTQKMSLSERLSKKDMENEVLSAKLADARTEIQALKSSASWLLAKKISKAGKLIPGKKIIKRRLKS